MIMIQPLSEFFWPILAYILNPTILFTNNKDICKVNVDFIK
jgi:hypothetical protein